MFERFTDRARRVVVLAQEESRMLNHDRIGTEHLLLGLLRDDSETARALEHAGISLIAARGQLEQSPGRGRKGPSGHIPFTARAKKSLELALQVSQRLGGQSIGSPHLLRAILEMPDSSAQQLLKVFSVNIDELAVVADNLAQNDAEAGTFDSPHLRVSRADRLARQAAVAPAARYGSADDIAADINSLATELAGRQNRLAAGLRYYGRHRAGCEPDSERGCTCGLEELLSEVDPSSAPQQDPSAL